MSETRTTYPCGCSVQTVGTGTAVAGTIRRYCEPHNPYRNTAPKIEIIG